MPTSSVRDMIATAGTSRFLLLPAAVAVVLGCSTVSITQDPIQVAQIGYGDDRTVNIFLVLPDQPSATGASPVILAFPWGDGTVDLVLSLLASYWDREAPARGYIVVGVEVFGLDLALDANEMIPAILAWMDQNLSYDRNRVVAVGASSGGTGLFHAALAAPGAFAALIGMPGEFSGAAADLQPLAGKPVWLLVGEQDTQWRDLANDTKDKLESQGVEVTLEVLPGQGHVMNIDQARLMDWIDGVLGR